MIQTCQTLIAVGVNLVAVASQCFHQLLDTCAAQMTIATTADQMFAGSASFDGICFPWDFDGHGVTAKAMQHDGFKEKTSNDQVCSTGRPQAGGGFNHSSPVGWKRCFASLARLGVRASGSTML